jgi:hypothetical protein
MENEVSKKINPPFTEDSDPDYFNPSSKLTVFIVMALLLLGLVVRLLDLTDPPLDFHPTRQLRAAIIARGMYYQRLESADPETREIAISLRNTIGDYEPSILESLVATPYRLVGGETLWLSRTLTSLAWVLGGGVLYLLGRRMTTIGGGLVAMCFYLFLPFTVYASRAFQPDPIMVMFLVFMMYAAYRWAEGREWKWALLTAAFAGISAYVKVFSAFFIAGMLIALVLKVRGLKRSLKDRQVWAMAIILTVPSVVYYLFSLGDGSTNYIQSWVIGLSSMLLEPSFYVHWLTFIDNFVGLIFIFSGFAGLLISRSPGRMMLFGLWVGYGVYGLCVPHQTTTHDYYHLPLIPIIALSLAPVASLIFSKIIYQGRVWRALFAGLLLIAVAYPAWIARSTLLGKDYHNEPPFWKEIGDAVPRNGKTIGLTQMYGHLLTYYGWKKVDVWPITGELELAARRGADTEFQTIFEDRIEDKDYFLVTNFEQLERQPALKEKLYADYPIIAQGDYYAIFDMRESTLEGD